jgi:hypothetical protein
MVKKPLWSAAESFGQLKYAALLLTPAFFTFLSKNSYFRISFPPALSSGHIAARCLWVLQIAFNYILNQNYCLFYCFASAAYEYVTAFRQQLCCFACLRILRGLLREQVFHCEACAVTADVRHFNKLNFLVSALPHVV